MIQNVVKPSNSPSNMPRQAVYRSPSTRMADLPHVRARSPLSPPPGTFGHWRISPLSFASRDLGRQPVELRLPKTSDLADPRIHPRKPRGTHRIAPPLSLGANPCN